MNLFDSCREYIQKIFMMPDEGIKILLVDSITVKYISTLFVMSEIMDYEIYLVENINNIREHIKAIKCIAILRPTNENINNLSSDLRRQIYGSYYIFFTHVLPKNQLQKLAAADENELVKEVLEFYIDFIPNSPFQFNMDLDNSMSFLEKYNSDDLSLMTDCLTGALMTLGKIPNLYYDSSSSSSSLLAENIKGFLNREERFFRNSDFSPIDVIIIDRSYDPITPLMNQWIYEAMIHELIGIKNNRVRLSSNQKDSILSYSSDEFFRENQFANFGEIGESIKKLVDDYQNKLQSVDVNSVESIADLKKFLENYPNFKKTSGTVETHFSILSELCKAVKDFNLMELSECEQQLVCQENHSSSFSRITNLLNDSRTRNLDSIRLVLLYILRYPSYLSEIEQLRSLIVNKGLSEHLELLDVIKKFSKKDYSAQTLKSVSSISNFNDIKSTNVNQIASKAMNLVTKKLVSGLRGIDNVYAQHQPAIVELIEKIIRNQIEMTGLSRMECNLSSKEDSSKDILLFIVGGMTYAEINAIQKLNKSCEPNIYIGSTFIHNTQTFLDGLLRTSTSFSKISKEEDERPLGQMDNPSRLGFISRNITSKLTRTTQYSKLN